jgi:RNA polymerase sigma-70 factor (ECF subfamily)
LGNIKDAEDITAQVFMDALEGLASYRERGNFSAWLFTIVRRRLIDLYRQRPVDLLPDDLPDVSFDLQSIAEKNETQLRLSQLLRELDDDRRELLQLRFAAGLDFSEIAVLLQRTEGAVKMGLYRTLDWVKTNWEKKS